MRRYLLIILVLFGLVSNAQSVKVMTYNIRYDNPQDGVNAWNNRKGKVTALLQTYDADIIGVQEALANQLDDITAALDGYAYIGVGRDDGKKAGEFSAILYRKDRFEVQDNNTFWLSEKPEVAGSKSWDAAITRVATWAVFRDKQTGRIFFFINTHFDHIGKEARRNSAGLLKQKVSELSPDVPVIMTGDFNCTREEEPYQVLTNGELIELIDPASSFEGTYCTFEVNTAECRAIDYIFVTNEWRADGYKVIKDNDGKHYPSDHLPVMITLSLTD